jgi:hypothetical protein
MQNDAHLIAEHYVALWNETDADKRRAAIEAFFAPDAAHFVGAREAKGYAALEARVIGSHEKNVRDGGFLFRVRPGAQKLRDVVTFHWEMVPRDDPDHIAAVGLEFVTLTREGKSLLDYMFVVA